MYRFSRTLTNRNKASAVSLTWQLSRTTIKVKTSKPVCLTTTRSFTYLTKQQQTYMSTMKNLSSIRRNMATVTENSHSNTQASLQQSPFLNWKLFPDFEQILTQTQPEVAVPFFQALFKSTQDQFLALEKSFDPTWEGSVVKLTELENDLSKAVGLLYHLNSVKNSEGLRTTLEKIQPDYVKLGLMINQSVPKYKALEGLKNSDEWNKLDKVQQRIIDKALLSMKHAGVGFSEGSPEKKRFNEISERLSHLKLNFSNNILDSTKAFKKLIHDKNELEGCSDTFLEILKKNAAQHKLDENGYCITLDYPIYGPFMMNCSNRSLRETVYKSNITKASKDKLNNEPIINEILTLQHEKANLLGYKTYADLSLSVKMANDLPTAEGLLDQLYTTSVKHAKKELDAMTQFAIDHLNHPKDQPLQPWDTNYVSEQYRKSLYKYDEETISEYFAFPKVMEGLFAVADEVLGIQVRELNDQELENKKMTKWHQDVKIYEVSEQGQVKAYFYGDFYSRPSEKRGGAWMNTVTSRYKDQNGHIVLPVAYLICNQATPRSEDVPSLMKFRDVETLFHEFGHCLQHMMTTVDYVDASGINGVEWDFVEVASQFMENFCSEPKWLDRLSGHYKTGQSMPKDMVDALIKNRQFLSGMAMLRQLHFAKVDLALYSKFTPPSNPNDPTIFDLDAEIAKSTILVPRLPEDRFLCSFEHIFGGGYAAGYYSYKYSETFSADAYGAFEEAQSNGESIKKVGKRYRDTVLALGGGTNPRQVWKEFRGRENVDVNALLRHSGLE